MQGIGDGELGERPRQRVVIAPIGHQTALQDRPGQLLDEQRHAVGLGDDPLDQLGRERLGAGQSGDQFADWRRLSRLSVSAVTFAGRS